MAGVSIGTWSVSILANASGLVNTMSDATSKVSAFASRAVTTARTMATGVNSALTSIVRVDLGQQTAQIGRLASAAAGIFTGFASGGPVGGAIAIGVAATAMLAYASASMDAVAVQVRLGRQIGISAQQAAGLQILAGRAGIDTDTMTNSLRMWAVQQGRLRQEIASGHRGPMTEALGRMGLNAEAFSRLQTPDQFAALSEGSSRLAEGTERSTSMMQILGRHAREIEPLFRQPAEDLRNMAGVAEQFGIVISQADAQAIAGTVRSLKELGAGVAAMFNNLGQNIAVMFAPVAAFASDTFRQLFKEAKPLFAAMQMIGVASLTPIIAIVLSVIGAIRMMMPVISAVGGVMTRVGAIVQQVFGVIARVAGEVFAAFSEAFGHPINPFEGWAALIQQLEPLILSAARTVGQAILNVFSTAVRGLRYFITSAAAVATVLAAITPGDAGDRMANRRDNLTNLVASLERAEQRANSFSEAMQNADVNAFPRESTIDTLRRWVDAAEQAQRASANMQAGGSTLLDAWQQQVRQAGMSSRAREFDDFMRQNPGATAAQQQALQDQDRLMTMRELSEEAQKQMRSLIESNALIGLNERERANELAVMRGMSEADRRGIDALHAQRELYQDMAAMQERATALYERNRNPAEAFRNRLDDAAEMARRGLISSEMQGREIFAATQEMMHRAGQEKGPAGAAAMGSVESQAAINAAMRQDRQDSQDPIRRVERVLERMERQNAQQLVVQQRLLDRFGDGLIQVDQIGD